MIFGLLASFAAFVHFEIMNSKLGNKYGHYDLGWRGSETDSGDGDEPDFELAKPSLSDDEGGLLGERVPPQNGGEGDGQQPQAKRRRVRGKQPPAPQPDEVHEGTATPQLDQLDQGAVTPEAHASPEVDHEDEGNHGDDEPDAEAEVESGAYEDAGGDEHAEPPQATPATKHKVTPCEEKWVEGEVKSYIRIAKKKPTAEFSKQLLTKGKAGNFIDPSMSLWQMSKVIKEKSSQRMQKLWAKHYEKEEAKGNNPRPTKFLRRSTVKLTTDPVLEESFMHLIHICFSLKLLCNSTPHPSVIAIASFCVLRHDAPLFT